MPWLRSAGTACIPPKPRSGRYILTALDGSEGPIIAATDYMKAVPDQLSPWLLGRLVTLGTETALDAKRTTANILRRHFEVNAESIVVAALSRLAREGKFDMQRVQEKQV